MRKGVLHMTLVVEVVTSYMCQGKYRASVVSDVGPTLEQNE